MPDDEPGRAPGVARKVLSPAEKAARIERAMTFDMRSVLRRYVIDTGASRQTAR